MKKISIIVAIYNSEKYLERCINSILNQSYNDLELILVDDGSTDSSFEICDNYKGVDDRIKVIHKSNGGLITARLAGIKNATGEYISFVDSDDWVEKENYSEMEKGMLLNADLVVGSYVIEDTNGEICQCFAKGQQEIYDKYNALLFMFNSQLFNWSGCNKLYHKSLFEGFPGWRSLNSYGEDTELNWYMFNHAQKICYVTTQGYHYCVNRNSMMHQPFRIDRMAYMDRMSNIFNELQSESNFLCHVVANLTVEFALEKFMMLIKIVEDDKIFTKYYMQLRQVLPYITFLPNNRQKKILDILARGFVGAKSYVEDMEKNVISQIRRIKSRKDKIYIYGAGTIAGEIIDIINSSGDSFDGVLISRRGKNGCFRGYEICCFDDLSDDDLQEYGFALAMNSVNSAEVIDKLNLKKVDYVDCGKYSINY